MKRLIAFLMVVTLLATSGGELIPPERLIDWRLEENVGVVGGIFQYRPGGVNERTDLVDVTASPYNAAGSTALTTGSISSGATSLTVADASTLNVGNHIVVGLNAIHDLTITQGASVTGTIYIYHGTLDSETTPNDTRPRTAVAVTAGDTPTQVATKIRAATHCAGLVTTSGSGATVRFTETEAGARLAVALYDPVTVLETFVQGTTTVIQTGSIVATTTITAKVGSTLTLADAASATVTNAIVEHDDAPAIIAAVSAAVSLGKEGVWLPQGSYTCRSQIVLGTSFAGKTFRGAGMGLTTLEIRTSSGLSLDGVTNTTPSGLVVTGGLTKGSTAITVPSWPGYTSGYMFLEIENDPSIPVMSIYNYDVFTHQAPQKQLVRLTGSSGTTVNIDPPLNASYSGEVRLVYLNTVVSGAGIEDLTVDCTKRITGGGAFAATGMGSVYNCWFYNVEAKQPLNYAMTVGNALQCEIRHSTAGDLKGNGSNGAAFLFTGWNCRIEDNIFVNGFPNVEMNAGSQGNVFLYNYGNGACNTNHGPHNRFNLHEGNAWYYHISDGYFGSESDLTFIGNYFHAPLEYGTVNGRRWTRNMTCVGNINGASEIGDHGYPFIGNTSYSGTIQYSVGSYGRDYGMTGTITSRTDDITGSITLNSGALGYDGNPEHRFMLHWNNKTSQCLCIVTAWSDPVATFTVLLGTAPPISTVVSVGPGSFAGTIPSYGERDLDVAATTINKGNYYLGSSTYTSLGGDTLPNGIAYTTRPAGWPTSLEWPPFVAADPSTADINRIPAGYRFTNGVDPDTELPGTGGKRVRPGGRQIRIDGKALRIGNN